MGMNLERQLAEAGFQIITTSHTNEKLILEILKSDETRYLKAIPFLLYRYELDIEWIYDTTQKKALFSQIVGDTLRIFTELGLTKKLPSLPKTETKTGFTYEELRDEFKLHYGAGQQLLIERNKFERERQLRMSLAQIFTLKERRTMERVRLGKPISKTDYEYYSRKTKKKLKSITDLEDFARTLLLVHPKPDADLYRLKKRLERWMEDHTPHKGVDILMFYRWEIDKVVIEFKKKDSQPYSAEQQWNTQLSLKKITDKEIISLLKDYSRADFR